MKKKGLLLVVLALAIITSLTAGTLAVYTTSTELETNEVKAKAFVMTAATQETEGIDLKVAPGDVRADGRGQEVYFYVRNYDATGVSEVPLEVKFDLTGTGDLFKVDGLDVKIIDNQDPKADAINQTGKSSWLYGYVNGSNGLRKAYGPEANAGGRRQILPAGVATEYVYRIRIQWLNTGKSTAHTDAGMNQLTGNLSLKVSATQVTD